MAVALPLVSHAQDTTGLSDQCATQLETAGLDPVSEKIWTLCNRAIAADLDNAKLRRTITGRHILEGTPERAIGHLRRAAEQGDLEAMAELGFMHVLGLGVEVDYAKALHWNRAPAEAGIADAQNAMGFLHHFGFDVELDLEEAHRWYHLAADQGNANAQANLGQLYLTGLGVDQDYAEAAKWLRLAAEQGQKDSQTELAKLYRQASVLSRNILEHFVGTVKLLTPEMPQRSLISVACTCWAKVSSRMITKLLAGFVSPPIKESLKPRTLSGSCISTAAVLKKT